MFVNAYLLALSQNLSNNLPKRTDHFLKYTYEKISAVSRYEPSNKKTELYYP